MSLVSCAGTSPAMLTRLLLKNYQPWGELDVQLSSFVVILGSSGSGKTSIVRALKSFVGTSAGTAVIKHGEKFFRIELDVDGNKMGWVKSASKNDYYLNDREFVKVGRDTPEPILDLLNLARFSLDSENYDLAISGQFDPPTMVFDAPSKAARILSVVSGVDYLVGIARNILRDIRDNQRIQEETSQERARILSDAELLRKLDLAVKWKSRANDILEVRRLEEQISEIDKLGYTELPPHRLPDLDLREYEGLLARIEELPASIPLPGTPVDDKEFEFRLGEYREVAERLGIIESMMQEAGLFKSRAIELQKNLHYLEQEAQEIGQVCPLCGSPTQWELRQELESSG